MKTANKYHLPIELSKEITPTCDSSPAHVGWLRYAIDFIAPLGTPIKSALDGIVVHVKDDSDIGGFSEEFDPFGNFIEIRHEHGEASIYEHIIKGSSLVKAGDAVKTGDTIARVGETGWIAGLGSHLHFDVHKYYGNGENEYESMEIEWIDNSLSFKINL